MVIITIMMMSYCVLVNILKAFGGHLPLPIAILLFFTSFYFSYSPNGMLPYNSSYTYLDY